MGWGDDNIAQNIGYANLFFANEQLLTQDSG
jgi:hypothetical protein